MFSGVLYDVLYGLLLPESKLYSVGVFLAKGQHPVIARIAVINNTEFREIKFFLVMHSFIFDPFYIGYCIFYSGIGGGTELKRDASSKTSLILVQFCIPSFQASVSCVTSVFVILFLMVFMSNGPACCPFIAR